MYSVLLDEAIGAKVLIPGVQPGPVPDGAGAPHFHQALIHSKRVRAVDPLAHPLLKLGEGQGGEIDFYGRLPLGNTDGIRTGRPVPRGEGFPRGGKLPLL